MWPIGVVLRCWLWLPNGNGRFIYVVSVTVSFILMISLIVERQPLYILVLNKNVLSGNFNYLVMLKFDLQAIILLKGAVVHTTLDRNVVMKRL